MAPRTRMTPEQVAASVELRRAAWTERTGVELVPQAEYEARKPAAIAEGKALSVLLARLNSIGRRQYDQPQPRLPVGPSRARDLSLTAARQGRAA